MRLNVMVGLLLGIVMMGLAGCGGGNGDSSYSAPPGTYKFTSDMISGNTYTSTTEQGFNSEYIFNSDGTVHVTNPNGSGTAIWSINSLGQLRMTYYDTSYSVFTPNSNSKNIIPVASIWIDPVHPANNITDGANIMTLVTPTATGKFVDAPVQGLKYVSGGQSGFTAPNGEFTYEVGKTVTFSVGGVVIGTAPGAGVVTPIDLVKTAAPGTTVTASTPAVVQIAQFLLTASSLTSTGIKIDQAVTTVCANQNINLSTATTSDFNSMINLVAVNVDNRTVTSATDALNHITASMSGLDSGTVVLPPASSLGGGTSSSTSTIVGVWRAVNGAGFNYLILFSNNTFVYAENDLSAPVTDNGVEVGTYTDNGTNITFNIAFDRNAPGDNSGVGDIGTPSVFEYVLSNNDNTLTFPRGPLVLSRVIFNSTDSVGVWRAVNGAGFNYLILFSNNTFVYAENDLSAPVTDNGVEVGTYTDNGTNITFNIAFDRNAPGDNSGVGDIGTPSVFEYVLSNNGNTFTVPRGPLVLTRAF